VRKEKEFEKVRTAITDEEKLDEIIVIGSSSCGWSSHRDDSET